MVSTRLLPARQREAIKEYLEERQIPAPAMIRTIRSRLLRGEIDLDQMLKDIVLLRDLMNLDLPTGRPTNAERDVKAFGFVKQGENKDTLTFILKSASNKAKERISKGDS